MWFHTLLHKFLKFLVCQSVVLGSFFSFSFAAAVGNEFNRDLPKSRKDGFVRMVKLVPKEGTLSRLAAGLFIPSLIIGAKVPTFDTSVSRGFPLAAWPSGKVGLPADQLVTTSVHVPCSLMESRVSGFLWSLQTKLLSTPSSGLSFVGLIKFPSRVFANIMMSNGPLPLIFRQTGQSIITKRTGPTSLINRDRRSSLQISTGGLKGLSAGMKFLLCFKAICFCRFSCNFFLLVASGMKNRNTLTASPNKRLVSNVDSGDLRTASRFADFQV